MLCTVLMCAAFTYINLYTYVFVCVCVRVHVCLYVCVGICVYLFVEGCVYVLEYGCVRILTCVYIHLCTCLCGCSHTRLYPHPFAPSSPNSLLPLHAPTSFYPVMPFRDPVHLAHTAVPLLLDLEKTLPTSKDSTGTSAGLTVTLFSGHDINILALLFALKADIMTPPKADELKYWPDYGKLVQRYDTIDTKK